MSNNTMLPPAGFDLDLLKKLAQFSNVQQIWLSGYLYGIALQGNSALADDLNAAFPVAAYATQTPKEARPPGISILYGSHTGNSKKVAQTLAQQLKNTGWTPNVQDLNEYPTRALKDEKLVLLVVSTQGEGEPPASAETFYKWLHSAKAPKLTGLKYAVCGLGDRSYTQFCQTGKDFDARLEALGAQRLLARIDCDVDYHEAIAAWSGQLSGALSVFQHTVVQQHTDASVVTAASVEAAPQFHRKHPFQAPVLEKIQLNGRGSAKETWHLELSLEGSGLQYEPGDALGVYAENDAALVDKILSFKKLEAETRLLFDGKETALCDILRVSELTLLTRPQLEQYAALAKQEQLTALLNDAKALRAFLYGRDLLDLLQEFPTEISANQLVALLRKLPPRLYSIASSPAAHPDELHLTVAAVRYDLRARLHHGVTSTFLADRLLTDETLPVFIERNEYFKLPANPETDIIMVGPGTGVAPFRAFVAERAEIGATGKNWLFFGNPHFETDFLYQTEWQQHLKRGTLDRLSVAFSRDQADKIYVQHRLLEHSRALFERIENGAHIYICGDKNRMAADVKQAFLNIISTESGKNADFAEEYFANLRQQRRYLEDVY